jgi:glycine dehydrogenase subunit 1
VVAHPYFAGSVDSERAAMLDALGLDHVSELYAAIPEPLRLARALDLPPAITSEADLARHLQDVLGQDPATPLHRCFRGGGCWPHVVPAICSEILDRAEFRTAYWGGPYSDHGKYQAFFEYASLMGELLELDAVSLPTYDWGNAAATCIRMAARITNRTRVVVIGDVAPERLRIIENYSKPDLTVVRVASNAGGLVHLEAAAAALDPTTAAVYVEVPSYLGVIDDHVEELCALAHSHGALIVAGVDPISLGVLAPPSAYGADLACGDLQPLGVGMHYGGGLSGFVASADERHIVAEYPTYLIGRTPTTIEGEHGFGFVAWERTSYVRREAGKDFSATTTANAAIAAAVYLSLLGPVGMRELGLGIIGRASYAAERLSALPGVSLPLAGAPHFKEIVVNFDAGGVTVAGVNDALHDRGFLGGLDLSEQRSDGAQNMLLCVTEAHRREDIDALVDAVADIVGGP